MSPVLGIIASSTQQGRGGVVGSYDSLASVTVPSGGVASIVFSGIPTTYQHLEIRGISRGVSSDDSIMRFNGDSNNNYRWHTIEGNGSTAYSTNNGGSAVANLYFARTPNGATAGANIFNGSITTILDYASATKNKTIRTLGGTDYNGSGTITLWSGLYMNTNPITSVTIQIQAGNLAQFSQFALYGVK